MEANDMDAFKELVTRSPDMELMSLDDLHGMVFWSGAAMKWAKTQIDIAKQIGGMTAQIDAWAREGNAAAELNFAARQRRGEMAAKEPQAQAPAIGGGPTVRGGKLPTDTPPKWQRLGYKSAAAMRDDEMLHKHAGVVEEVKKKAKDAGDFPSITAVKATIRYKSAEKKASEAKSAETEKRVKETPKGVKEYLDGLGEYRKLVRFTIDYAKRDRFAPEWKQFVVKRHDELRQLLNELEESL